MQKEAFKEDQRDQRADNNRNNRRDLKTWLYFVVEEFPLFPSPTRPL
jgi:hypothetical protein